MFSKPAGRKMQSATVMPVRLHSLCSSPHKNKSFEHLPYQHEIFEEKRQTLLFPAIHNVLKGPMKSQRHRYCWYFPKSETGQLTSSSKGAALRICTEVLSQRGVLSVAVEDWPHTIIHHCTFLPCTDWIQGLSWTRRKHKMMRETLVQEDCMFSRLLTSCCWIPVSFFFQIKSWWRELQRELYWDFPSSLSPPDFNALGNNSCPGKIFLNLSGFWILM